MRDKVLSIIEILKQKYPDSVCALHYEKDYELMIAVRLSAQCTDARVNLITPALFARFPTLDSFAEADVAEVEQYVHSCGFYKHKARDIVLGCQMLLTDYDAAGFVCGTDFRFGSKGQGTAGLLQQYCRENGLQHDEVLFVGDDYGRGGNDESVFVSDFGSIKVDDYTKLGEYVKELL